MNPQAAPLGDSLMRRIFTLAVVVLAALASVALATEGGYKDPATGKIWSQSLTQMTGGISDYTWALSYAANYSVTENNVVYSDWRLPKVAELQQAVADGTIQTLNLAGPYVVTSTRAFWTTESKGNKQWAVFINFDATGHVISSNAQLVLRNGSFLDFYMIRP